MSQYLGRNTLRVLVALMLLSCVLSAHAATYTAIDLFTLTGPGQSTFGHADQQQAAAGRQVVGSGTTSHNHALLWSSTVPVDLNPANFLSPVAVATDGGRQVGSGKLVVGPVTHAMLWAGSAVSGVDLHPTALANFVSSLAVGLGSTQQVGNGDYENGAGSARHALLWSGTAASAIDLHPVNLPAYAAGDSYAVAAAGGRQGGIATIDDANGSHSHPILWNGTAASALDLTPTNLAPLFGSGINGLGGSNGSQQVGSGGGADTNNQVHALLWNGTPIATDLHPANLSGFVASTAYATNGTNQVGYLLNPTGVFYVFRAVVWSGTANSAVDLQSLLPIGLDSSIAYGIDDAGNVYGVANDASGATHAIMWAVPEPSSLGLIVIAPFALFRRRASNRVTGTGDPTTPPRTSPTPPTAPRSATALQNRLATSAAGSSSILPTPPSNSRRDRGGPLEAQPPPGRQADDLPEPRAEM